MKEQLQKAIAEGEKITVFLKTCQPGCDKVINELIVAADEIGICLKVYCVLTMIPWENVEKIILNQGKY